MGGEPLGAAFHIVGVGGICGDAGEAEEVEVEFEGGGHDGGKFVGSTEVADFAGVAIVKFGASLFES